MQIVEKDITQWVETYTDSMYEWAVYKLQDEELAKDVIQDTFMAAFEKLDRFEGKSSAKTWLFSIMNHKIADHLRRRFKDPVLSAADCEGKFFDDDGMWLSDKRPQEWGENINLLDTPGFVNVINNCIEKLPFLWHSVICLKYLSEKEGSEVCKELNISATNFWQIAHRAKLNLRACLELNWFKH